MWRLRRGILSRNATDGAVGDPSFANVLLLSGFEGADAGTTFDDESSFNRTYTALGNTQIDTAQFKFDTSSLLCDGTGDCATVPDSTDWNFAGPFTIEMFFRVAADNAATRVLLAHRATAAGTNGWQLYIIAPAAGNDTIGMGWSTDGTADLWNLTFAAASMINASTWYHGAWDRDSSDVIRIYLDGVMKASMTQNGEPFNNAQPLSVGAQAAGTNGFNGHIDEVRISSVSRYGDVYGDGGFTAPILAFPRS